MHTDARIKFLYDATIILNVFTRKTRSQQNLAPQISLCIRQVGFYCWSIRKFVQAMGSHNIFQQALLRYRTALPLL